MGRPPKEEFPAPKAYKRVPLELDVEVAADLQRYVESEQARYRDEGRDWRLVSMNRVLNLAARHFVRNLIRTGKLPARGEEGGEDPSPPKARKK